MHLEAECSASVMLQACSECNNLKPLCSPNLTEPASQRSSLVKKTPVLTQSVVGQALGKHDIAE